MIRSLFSMVILVMISTSMVGCNSQSAESVTPCPVDSIPIQIEYAFKSGNVTTLSAVDLDYSAPFHKFFSFFVKDVTEHLATKLAQEKLCLNSFESQKSSLIQFMPWGINIGSRPVTSVPPLQDKPLGVCRISSPWLDLVVERKPVPSIRGIVRYNERQLLADQAILAGARNVPPGVAMPLTYEEFNRYADLEYFSSEIHHKPADKPVEERVPPDILWLLRRARQDENPGHFSGTAGSSMREAMRAGAEAYTKIVTTLIDHCFESDGADIQFNSILDLADLVSLEEFKIETSIISEPEYGN